MQSCADTTPVVGEEEEEEDGHGRVDSGAGGEDVSDPAGRCREDRISTQSVR